MIPIALRRLSDNQLGFGALSQAPQTWGEIVALNQAGIFPSVYGEYWLVSFEGSCTAAPASTFATEYEILDGE